MTIRAQKVRFDDSPGIARLIDTGKLFQIAQGKKSYIALSKEEYSSLIETAYINSVPGLAESIIEGANTPIGELIEVDWRNELQS